MSNRDKIKRFFIGFTVGLTVFSIVAALLLAAFCASLAQSPEVRLAHKLYRLEQSEKPKCVKAAVKLGLLYQFYLERRGIER